MDDAVKELLKRNTEWPKKIKLGKKPTIKEIKKNAKRNKKLFEEGKRAFDESWQNEKALVDIVEERRDSIKKAFEALGIEVED